VTTDQPESEQPPDIPSYEKSLIAQHGADGVARYRAEMLPNLQYGDARTALGVDDNAPPFTLTDATGTRYVLTDLLKQGPVVAIFYRGGWCPFCNVQLRAFQLARTRIRALKASVVLISPEQIEQTLSLIERHTLQFPVLTDVGNQVARQYGLAFQFDPALRERYLEEEIDLTELNGDVPWELPMPATFIIDPQGKIRYAFVSTDYTQRSEPAEVLAVLQRLKR
jgi:peroxiredoxin